jgi:hypothetical protein
MTAMPLMIAALCAMAIAYRHYSAFLAAKVAMLDATRITPAISLDDGVNYHPTNKWVLFGHHFAAISGAGPLIGPVLAAQFGYLPGLLWIVIGVCLAGAVQDFLVLAVSVRRGGKSLAQIAFSDVGKIAGTAAMIAILFILVIALAGLGKVVVKALGGDTIKNASGQIIHIPGSSWGIFTIACTIPIALFVGLYMYRIRKGKVIEASIIGGLLTLAATVAGGWIAHHSIVESHRRSGVVRDGNLRFCRRGITGVGAAGAAGLSVQFSEDRHDRTAGGRCDRCQSIHESAGDQPRIYERRPGCSGQDFPVPVHHHYVRSHQRISRAGEQRHHIENAGQRKRCPHDWLWCDAHGRIGWCGGNDCRFDFVGR